MAVKIEDLAKAVGRRKTSVARVYLRKGPASMTVNGKPFDEHFFDDYHRNWALQPLLLANALDQYSIVMTVYGGGVTGQAGAVRHALARALSSFLPDNIKVLMRQNGALTRDSRKVERKKFGLRKARRGHQFSKR